MEMTMTPLDGLLILQAVPFQDERGGFRKLFNEDFFREHGLATDFREFYYSVNRKGVIRGMHFQTPPCDHEKLVYVSKGRILDVVLDIRKASTTFGKYFETELNDTDGDYLYIPKGFAHGFCSLEEGTVVHYAQTSCYDREHDSGIFYRSFGYTWPTEDPVLSPRDGSFPAFQDFNSPF
ncbi:MAG: dTDP-4-dehydrorhamnose 3,5-epimerase family protein [Bacteroidales bacterium]|nr:dTDP-4-dehydrorhamnose 3,5-epimerase family protein [Bacteroidales bacterium]